MTRNAIELWAADIVLAEEPRSHQFFADLAVVCVNVRARSKDVDNRRDLQNHARLYAAAARQLLTQNRETAVHA